MSAGRWLSSARVAGFTSVVPASSHLLAASCAMTKSLGQMAREPITTRIFKILQGIGDRLLGSARVPNMTRLRYRREMLGYRGSGPELCRMSSTGRTRGGLGQYRRDG